MSAIVQVEWSGCPLLEVEAEIQSGAGARGTHAPIGAIVDDAKSGLSTREISEQFAVSEAEVKAIFSYPGGHRIADPVR